MKKIIVVLLVLFSIFIISCSSRNTQTTDVELSDLQIEACNSADEQGTCNSRLPEVGIVLEDECCEVLGKCC